MAKSGRRPVVAGNWKMNGRRDSVAVLEDVRAGYDAALSRRVDLVVCPPATLIQAFVEGAKGSPIGIGGQDAHAEAAGAFTGNVSAEMLADLGAAYVILGHSERRAYHHESDADVRAKALAARRAGIVAIVCVGETREEREAGRAPDVVAAQTIGSVPEGARGDDLIVAYEPVWAIGTGLIPTVADVAEMHARVRAELGNVIGDHEAGRVRVLYGGSVKPSNARELLGIANVDGALVGGACLVAADFLGIARAYLDRA